MAVTGLLALGAAVLSFTGLYSVAVAGGISARLAPIWPICIDAVSTVALIVLRPASLADLRAARAAVTSAPVSAPANSTAPAAVDRPVPARSARTAQAPAVRTASAPRHRAADKPALQSVPAPAGADPDTVALARTVVDSGVTTRSLEQVEQVLAAHAAGTAITRIAADTGVHHATVRKIINATAEHRQLATVG